MTSSPPEDRADLRMAIGILATVALVAAVAALISIWLIGTAHGSPQCRTLAEVRAASSAWPRWTVINGRRCWYTGSRSTARRAAMRREPPVAILPPPEPRPAPAGAPEVPPPPPLPPDPLRPSTAFAGGLTPGPVAVLATRADMAMPNLPVDKPAPIASRPAPDIRTTWLVFLLATTAGAALIFVLYNMVIPAPTSRRRPAKRAKPEPWPPADLDFELPAWCLKEAERYNGRG